MSDFICLLLDHSQTVSHVHPLFLDAIIEFKQGEIPEALGVIHLITMPLQGVLNALVYFRPKFKSYRASHPSASRVSSMLRVLKISIPAVNCCSTSKSQANADGENRIENQKEKEEVGKEGKIGCNNVAANNEEAMGEKAKTSIVKFDDNVL